MSVQDRYPDFKADQREFFDELITEDWDRYLGPSSILLWRFEVKRLFARVRPRTILNVGCGCGFHDAEMISYPFVEALDAIDYSPKSVERANAQFARPGIRREVGDFMKWPVEKRYDLVVSFQVIEHLEDAKGFLEKCARHAAPGGRVAAFTVNLLRPYNRKRMKFGKKPEFEDPMHCQEFTRASLRRLAENAGLEVESLFPYMSQPNAPPHRLRHWLGYLLPSLGARLAIICRAPGADG